MLDSSGVQSITGEVWMLLCARLQVVGIEVKSIVKFGWGRLDCMLCV